MQFRKHGLLAVGLVISLLSGMVAAESVAIAYSRTSDEWGWARRATQKEANKVALNLCNEDAPKRDCILSSIKALVRADGPGRIGYGASAKSIADAKRIAVANCKHPDCKVTDVLTQPGFITLSKSEEDAEGNAIIHIAYAFKNADNADKTAQDECRARSGQDCKIILSSSIPGTLSSESTADIKPTAPVASKQNCRPNTPTVRCTSNCVNGNCVVTYENGCEMRVQVSPRYDSFQNTWVYPSPSC